MVTSMELSLIVLDQYQMQTTHLYKFGYLLNWEQITLQTLTLTVDSLFWNNLILGMDEFSANTTDSLLYFSFDYDDPVLG